MGDRQRPEDAVPRAMSSLYFDLMVSNERLASVSIRKMTTIVGSNPTWAYEIVQTKPKTAPTRGTVEDDGTDQLLLVNKVLTDYFAGRKATS